MLDDLDGPALKAWQDYHEQMQLRYGKGIGRGSYFHDRYRNVYRKIAELCSKNSVDVSDYMLRGFDLLTRTKHQYITPKDFIFDGRVMAAYLKNRQTYGEDALASWVMEEIALTDIVCRLVPKMYPSEEAILKDPDTPFTTWFRVLYPRVHSAMLFKLYGQVAWHTLKVDSKLRKLARRQSPLNLQELERQWGKLDNEIGEVTVHDQIHA